jgi:hypothetical protein
MWGWFGGQAAQKRKDAPKNAILNLRQTLDMLQKRERHLETQMAEQEALARKNITTNKTGRYPFPCVCPDCSDIYVEMSMRVWVQVLMTM